VTESGPERGATTGDAPLVSVLMPFRDASATVEQAASSILDQRGVTLELVAVDDGSRDDGPARMRAVAARDARVVLVAGEGRGIVGALARGLAVARGAVIARMDADDVALPGRLARQASALADDARLGVVATQVETLGPCGEGMRRYVAWQNGVVTASDHARELFVESPVCHPSVALPRAALDAVGGWRDAPWAEDYDLWLRLDAAGWRIAKIPSVLLLWRQREGSLTFSDPRYSLERFREARACYLAPKLRRTGRAVVVWGAGRTGRLLSRALEAHGVHARSFVDIDPRKIGRTARGAPIVAPDSLSAGEAIVVVAVGARGARQTVREHLAARRFVEGEDFVCAA
jgi:glycosyltransferase involved in cell wall biosynthesis